jgi:hypothetical protein
MFVSAFVCLIPECHPRQVGYLNVVTCSTQTACLAINWYKNRPFRTVQTVRKKDGVYRLIETLKN